MRGTPSWGYEVIWGFPKIRGTLARVYSIWGSISGSPYLGKVPYKGSIGT